MIVDDPLVAPNYPVPRHANIKRRTWRGRRERWRIGGHRPRESDGGPVQAPKLSFADPGIIVKMAAGSVR